MIISLSAVRDHSLRNQFRRVSSSLNPTLYSSIITVVRSSEATLSTLIPLLAPVSLYHAVKIKIQVLATSLVHTSQPSSELRVSLA